MIITDIKTYVLSTPLEEPFAFSMGWVTRRSTMIVELITDEGVTGWGESLCHGLQPPEIAKTIVDVALKPLLIGQDPADVDVLWERMYNLTRPFGQKGAVPNAISAVDIGLPGPGCGQTSVQVAGRSVPQFGSTLRHRFLSCRGQVVSARRRGRGKTAHGQRLYCHEAQNRFWC